MSSEQVSEQPRMPATTTLTVSVANPDADEQRTFTAGPVTGGRAAETAPAAGEARRTTKDALSDQQAAKAGKAEKPKDLSPQTAAMRNRLPALADDAEVGVEKEHIVTRDDKPDLLFTGVLLASAAPDRALKGEWQEYRIYETHTGKHVFSKITRNVLAETEDHAEAAVFDPSPSTVQSQLIRGARELARARPLTWKDSAVSFFGYDPLAKQLYRKLSVHFEEQL